MKYRLYKLRFSTAVHFGAGGLTKTQRILYADTLFSALCSEAVKMSEDILQQLVEAVRENRLRFTDGLPCIGETLYVPKPIMSIRFEKEGDSTVKKAVKKLEYIPVELLDSYLTGSMDLSEESKKLSDSFGRKLLIEKVAVNDAEDSEPYAVEVFKFAKNSGLYLCIGFERDQDMDLAVELLESLSLNGIGGKISSGYGKFDFVSLKMPDSFIKRLSGSYDRYMSLSISVPSDQELDRVLLDAGYRMIRRGGFVASANYAETFRKKREVYLLASGSTVTEPFAGELLDLSNGEGRHPVYRYAKPFLMGVI